MYEYFDINPDNIEFEWDDAKEEINYTKHGIHFKTAAHVFLDPNKLIREDLEHSEDEDRYDILWKVGKVIFVVCVFREDNIIRIISARPASILERKRYSYGEDFDEGLIG